MSQPDLSSEWLGLPLRTPLAASSSPLTGNLDDLRRLEDAGASLVVLPSLFEEQITGEAVEIDRALTQGTGAFAEALDFFPELEDYNTGPDRYLELVTRASERLGIPVVASLNGSSPGGWTRHARWIEQAGAAALELNVYLVAADGSLDAASVERRVLELVAAVRESVRIPLAVKIGPHWTSLAHLAPRLVGAGADGLVLFNRFYQPDLELESLEVVPRLVLSSREELRLPLRWIALLHDRLSAQLGASSGIHEAEDALKALLAGAHVAFLASALLERGPAHLAEVELELRAWLAEREYESVQQLRGSVSQGAVPDPSAWERANYVRTLQSWSSRFAH